jgi:PAS domain S-box-containing protein/putative nucleotidyltransferase with HDIG domain
MPGLPESVRLRKSFFNTMNREEILYLAPYLFSLLLSLGIFSYTWRHRHVRGARTYAWFVGGQTITLVGFMFELISPALEVKIFWDKFQWLTLSYLVILPLLMFSIQYSEHTLRQPAFFWGPVLIFLTIFTALLLTDDIHHLFYPNPRLNNAYPFPELEYEFTFIIYIYVLIYLYGANLYGISLLIRRALQPYNPYSSQYWIIVAGLLIPLLLSFFTLTDIQITPQRDVTPFALAIGNMIVAWGLFRYGLFDIAPIAREQIIENMRDPVIVLDPMNRIVDINQAALTLMGKPVSEVIGRSSALAFAKWPFVIELLREPAEQRREVSATSAGRTLFFDISISHIFDRNRELIGRIIVARDITELKTLQINYQTLSEELEQRVRERTEELRNSAERYRAVVENQTEFIVRWKPDGPRTFVNEAYCRYWGISYEQALAINFLFHIAEEDRPAVEEKIARLHAGLVDVETEVHRVIQPDDNIAWQEWTDQAIRDEWGKLIEIQSVGRDITERKHAEERLVEAYETTLEGWAKALELRDKETEGHSRRVTEATLVVARAMGFSEEDLTHVRRGSLLHDIGKMVIPDEILRKNGSLTEEERSIVEKHPITALELLKGIPFLEKALEIPCCHHEKWDGSGYPCGLKGNEIPLTARIFTAVDVWDALSTNRPYREAWPQEKVIDYLLDQSEKHFDPKVVEVFLGLLHEGKI